MTADAFRARLLQRVFEWCYRWQSCEVDYVRYTRSHGRGPIAWMTGLLRRMAQRYGWAHSEFACSSAAEQLLGMLGDADRYADLYGKLSDAASRELLFDLLAYRVLGHQHVRLPLYGRAYWRKFDSVNRVYRRQAAVRRVGALELSHYEVPGERGPLRIEAHPWSILNSFLVEQYAYSKVEPAIRARPGDTVIDGGGCWGDTALYFLDRTGEEGRVFTFEFLDENLAVMRRNMISNPHLADRLTIVERALWNTSNERMSFVSNGAGTRLQSTASPLSDDSVATLTIDDLVAQHQLARVDFIKLDIEGAELPALRGAAATLRRFRPTLAVAAYHRPDDLVAIPDQLDALDLGYRYYLDHFTVRAEETVLFAVAEPAAHEAPTC